MVWSVRPPVRDDVLRDLLRSDHRDSLAVELRQYEPPAARLHQRREGERAGDRCMCVVGLRVSFRPECFSVHLVEVLSGLSFDADGGL